MSSANQRKRNRKWFKSDIEARAEGKAIKIMQIIGPVQRPTLHKTYRIGQGLSGIMMTGEKHRTI